MNDYAHYINSQKGRTWTIYNFDMYKFAKIIMKGIINSEINVEITRWGWRKDQRVLRAQSKYQSWWWYLTLGGKWMHVYFVISP